MKIAITSGAFCTATKRLFSTYFNLDSVIVSNIVVDSDLYIFSGGADINPEIYGEKNRLSSGINKARDKFELSLLKHAIKTGKKILGICRGHQLINAALGGSLYQDLSEISSNSYHGSDHSLIRINQGIVPDCFLRVNSLHHQAVKKPGKGLIITSAYNNCIESTEGENIITVQFHPEIMKDNYDFFQYIVRWVDVC